MLIRPRAFACALALSLHVSAAGSDEVLPKVEVTGARYDQRREETAARLVLDRAELLRHGDRTLGEALQRVAGVTVGNGGGRGGDIRLRGLGSGYTQVLLNGVAAPNGFAVESLAPELIERVDIIRTASAELGAQSIAGTINIVLRKAPAEARTTLKGGLDRRRGAYSSSLGLETGGKAEGTAWALPVTLARTRIGTRLQEDEQAPGLLRSARQEEMNAASTLTLNPRASWTLAGGDKLDLRGLASAMRRAIDLTASETALLGAPSRYPERGSLFEASGTWLRADLLWKRELGEGMRAEAKAGVNRSARNSDFEFGAAENGTRGPGVHFVRADFKEHGIDGGASMHAVMKGGHTLTAGWDGARLRRTQSRIGRDYDVPGMDVALRDDLYQGRIDRLGVYLQDEWELAPAWSLSLGWRWETLSTTVAGVQAGDVEQRSTIGSPTLQALHRLAPGRQLRVGLTRSYKAPTMASLIPRRYVVDNNNSATNPDMEGNPALRPEKAWGLDVGYDHHVGKDGLFAASAYVRRVRDVTVQRLFRDGEAWVAAPDNQGKALVRGLALEAKYTMIGKLALNANVARNWSRVDSIPGPDNRLDGQAPLTASAAVEYKGAVRIGASMHYARGALSRRSAYWTSWNGATRALDVYAVWGKLRISAANLLEKDEVAGARYGDRQTQFRTSTGAVLRITYDMDL